MKRILSAVLGLMMLLLSACSVAPLRVQSPKEYFEGDTKLSVHFIDVGQGDATLLQSDGEFVLIDAGEREYGATVVDYIEACGADSLKYVIATHPHSDHVGGLVEVIRDLDCENFITCETDQSTATWLNVLKAVDTYDLNYIDAEVGDTYTFGSAAFTILAPLSDSYSGYNNYSVVTKVTCGDVSFMLTGDAEKASEGEMVNAGEDLSADVLKCGHHGSSTATAWSFLSEVNPRYAVISCGADNEYGHPHTETIRNLDLMGVPYYRTDIYGTIVARTDGSGLLFSSEYGEIENEDILIADTASTEAPTAAPDTAAPDTAVAAAYIGNRNSYVFHLPSCTGVATMSEHNRVTFSTRKAALDAGYHPCGKCNP